MPDIETLTKLGPIPALIIALNGVLWLLKKSAPGFPRWLIPWAAILLGALVFPLIVETGKVPYTIPSPLTAQVLVGMTIGLASVGSNQWFIKTMQKMGFWTEPTES